MTEILFMSIFLGGCGYLLGKLFYKLNPFLMLIGFVILAGMTPAFIELNNNYYTICFVIGAILNFNRPLTYIRSLFNDLLNTLSLRRLSTNYAENIDQQKQQAEQDLYTQKRQVEEELKRQKYEAEQDIERQRREAEEAIRREAENLKREQERARKNNQSYSSENKGKQSQNSQQSSGSHSSTNQRHLNPRIFADACEILGMGQGNTLKEYKRAYKELISQYHSDKLSGLSEELKKQEEEKAKMLNMAMATIKKKMI